MSIALFKEVTTEDYLLELEKKSKECHEGLWADMSDAAQRKHVKDSAEHINSILKRLDRARIDKKKDFSVRVENEASEIRVRLEKANSPFTLLIDEWKDKRAKILAKEKRIREAKELAIQIEKDHEFALLIDAQMMSEKEEKQRLQLEREEQLKVDAVAKAKKEMEEDIEREKQLRIRNENERLANTEHLKAVNNAILDKLTSIGLSNATAKNVVCAIAKGEIPHVKINY